MSSKRYFHKGETPPQDYLERKSKMAAKDEAIRKKWFPERKGFDIQHEHGGYYYAPQTVRGCVCHRKPIVVLAIDRKDPLDPEFVPRWICICNACFIRTPDCRSPEAAVHSWNHAILTPWSRRLHKRLTKDDLDMNGIAAMLEALTKQAGNELVEYYRTERKLKKHRADHDHDSELKSARGHIQDLEGFFRESFFYEDLDRNAMIETLRKRCALDHDPVPVQRGRKKKGVSDERTEDDE